MSAIMNWTIRADFECLVLGQLLLESHAMPEVLDILTPHTFIHKHVESVAEAIELRMVNHSWIYATMEEMYKRGDKVNILTVSKEINRKWNVNATHQISVLTDRVCSSAWVADHALTLVEDTLRRQLINTISDVITHHDPLDDKVVEMRLMVHKIEQGYDPIDAAIKFKGFARSFGLTELEKRLETISAQCEAKLAIYQNKVKSRQLIDRLVEQVCSPLSGAMVTQLYDIVRYSASTDKPDTDVVKYVNMAHNSIKNIKKPNQ